MQSPLYPDIRTYKSTITVHEKTIRYIVNLSKNYAQCSLKTLPNGSIEVHAPSGTTPETVEDMIRSYLKRIQEQDWDHHGGPGTIFGGTIHMKGLDIPYSVVINRRRKGLYLLVYPDGRVEVETPHPTSDDEISQFIHSEKEWIYREYYRTRPECPPETEKRTIRIHDTEVPYLIKRSPRAKRLTLKIHGTGTIEVLAPYDLESEKIVAYIESQTEWIAPRVNLMPAQVPPPKENKIPLPGGNSGEIEYNGHTIPYHIKTSNRAKRIIIKINRDREVNIVSPPHTRASEIRALVEEKADWIYKNTIESDRQVPPHREYCDGELFPFMGDSITIKINKGTGALYTRQSQDLIITIPPGLTEFHEKKVLKQAVSAYFYEALYQFSLPHVISYAEKLHIPIPKVKIRDQKSKWGTCTPHSIILNLRLCMAPQDVIEYVIVHELAHKVNPDHSPRFWSTVENLMPDYKEKRDYLKRYGYALAL